MLGKALRGCRSIGANEEFGSILILNPLGRFAPAGPLGTTYGIAVLGLDRFASGAGAAAEQIRRLQPIVGDVFFDASDRLGFFFFQLLIDFGIERRAFGQKFLVCFFCYVEPF